MNLTDKDRQERRAFLKQLIRIPSVKGSASARAPFGAATLEALQTFLAKAQADGFRTKVIDGKVGYLEFGPDTASAPLLAAVCHLDVVPAGDWQQAFEPQLIDGRMVGRGSIDDKGPAVAVYFGLKRLLQEGYEPRCKLRLILGLDEESGSDCMKRYTKTEQLPVAAFTPDAEFPVIHAEKGLLQFTLTLSWPETTVPADKLTLLAAHAGTRANVVPGDCHLTWQLPDGRHESETVTGVMGHASLPQAAENAISKAMEQARLRLAATGQTQPWLEFYQQQIGMCYDGRLMGLAGKDAVSGPLTFNAGVLQLDAQQARLTCDIRYPVTWDVAELRTKIRSACEPYGVQYTENHHAAPLYLAKDQPLVMILTRIYNEQTGQQAEPIAIGGGTYARSLPNTVAFGPVFPGQPGVCHQTGEYADLASLERSEAIYTEAFRQLDQAFAR
ncbi:MAG: M20/M25/M40 family metallo-hydrolase [Oscillospiraceae bacterium]|nr:M20/M25/M40 family metallo-hydrolase [Oscillospiraceae bacterium]MDD4368633.1 M20/M25/M40 family metallo-hydrolase [Oscillospiraceae bacterium]